ncbi:MAG: hypothetical protein FWF59_03510 [Turicibacter sp.]|nr:hypothetical protein [Turicibacter sp.]
MKICLQKDQVSINLAMGFSWTLFFFSFMRLFAIGSYKSGCLLLALFAGLPCLLGPVVGYFLFFLINLSLCFVINRQRLLFYLQDGYLPAEAIDRELLKSEGLL